MIDPGLALSRCHLFKVVYHQVYNVYEDEASFHMQSGTTRGHRGGGVFGRKPRDRDLPVSVRLPKQLLYTNFSHSMILPPLPNCWTKSISASVGLADYSQADIPALKYNPVNFGTERGPVVCLPKHLLHTDISRTPRWIKTHV